MRKPTILAQYLFSCINKSMYKEGMPSIKSLDLNAYKVNMFLYKVKISPSTCDTFKAFINLLLDLNLFTVTIDTLVITFLVFTCVSLSIVVQFPKMNTDRLLNKL